jgi:hypothetical protein
LILIQDNPATIFSIKEIAALAAEQAVFRFQCCTTIEISWDSEGVPGSYNHPKGVAGA